jgi:hypothetical protein
MRSGSTGAADNQLKTPCHPSDDKQQNGWKYSWWGAGRTFAKKGTVVNHLVVADDFSLYLSLYQCYGGDKKIEEIIYTRYSASTPPHRCPTPPPNPTWVERTGRGGVRYVGWGVWGGAFGGWGVRRTSCIYKHIHTCLYQSYGKEQNRKFSYSISYVFICNISSGKIDYNSAHS